MFGKGSLIIIFGFIMAFSNYQLKLGKAVISTADNFNFYYTRSFVHEKAMSAMNYAINKVWDQNVTSDDFSIIADGCTTTVDIYQSGLDTIVIKVESWNYAFNEEYFSEHQEAYKVQDSVFAYFSYQMPVSRYFWFTNQEAGVYWISGDTVWGPMHTNSVLRTSGTPVFYGKVTAKTGIAPNPARRGNRAKFYGGWEIGIDNEVPTDMTHLVSAATTGNGGAATNTKSIYNLETTFEFQSDGSVIRTVSGSPADTVMITDIAPTGVIYSTADVRVSGVLNGQVTVYSADNIWIDDDVVYAVDPNIDPDSDDILGLVANNNVVMTNNSANNSDINIQATIMAATGSFTAQDYSGRPVAGAIYLTGSVVQNRRGPVGTFSRWSNSINHGFSKRYRYDPRLQSLSAPYYPYVRNLHLVSWWE